MFRDLTEVDEQGVQLVFRNSHACVYDLDIETDERLSVLYKTFFRKLGDRGRILGIGNNSVNIAVSCLCLVI